MKIHISTIKNEYLENISFENMETIHKTFQKFSLIKEPLEVKFFAINESISSDKLSIIKKHFQSSNVSSLCIYSNIRDTVIAGKSLKINSTFVKEKEIKNELLVKASKKKDDTLHEGTLRSGDRLSSNGNLFIVGDVNPGAVVSAKKNIYIWGKLLGIAHAGNYGNNKASIASLYLNPLQLRIADVVAIGPKDKPKNNYPEIALIDKQIIIIKPFIFDTKN